MSALHLIFNEGKYVGDNGINQSTKVGTGTLTPGFDENCPEQGAWYFERPSPSKHKTRYRERITVRRLYTLGGSDSLFL